MFSGLKKGNRSSARRRGFGRPSCEAMELRQLLAVVTVTSQADLVDPNDGEVTLREAILTANANPDLTTILFNIPGPGPHTIHALTPLPTITEPTEIFGTSQAGSAQNTLIDGLDAVQQVVISGDQLQVQTNPDGTPANGLVLASDNNVIIGLVINSFPGDGILITDAIGEGRNNLVRDNFIGSNASGTAPAPNGGAGVRIRSSNNQIGGNVPSAKNLIAWNGAGVVIEGRSGTGNQVEGNFISFNAEDGILVRSSNNVIGGPGASSRNVITGNGFASNRSYVDAHGRTIRGFSGIRITGITDAGSTITDAFGQVIVSGNEVINNYIGDSFDTDTARRFRGGNARDGVRIEQARNNRVGGPNRERSNSIADSGHGAWNQDGTVDFATAGVNIIGEGSTSNVVQANLIGFNQTAGILLILPNRDGIRVDSARNLLGGDTLDAGNTIAFNSANGIRLIGPGAFENLVQGNFIGTNTQGETDTGNALSGVLIENAARNVIGGTTELARNVISGNNWGVSLIGGGSTGNTVLGNFIGVSNDGSLDLGNALDGVRLVDAPGNTIGGLAPGAGNVISHNNRGVRISGPGSAGNSVQGNLIGVASDRTTRAGNDVDGVIIESGATDNRIGGADAAAGNIIAYSGGNGILVTGPATVDNPVLSNSIFQNALLGIDNANGGNREPAVAPPVLDPFFSDNTGTRITGRLQGLPNTTFLVQFFANEGVGLAQAEGQTPIGSATVLTGANGFAAINFSTSVVVPSNQLVTATATVLASGGARSTSEFSPAAQSTNSSPLPGGIFVVNTTLDTVNPNDGLLSLREAILAANASPGQDQIRFNIPGAGALVIQPSTPLPAILDSTIIDGFTQPGTTPNGADAGFLNATLRIVINGSLAGANADGLVVQAPNTTIRGLVINQFDGSGIAVVGPTAVGAVIEGNYIGTDATGSVFVGQGNGRDGVRLESSNALVGGFTPASRNLISGNARGVTVSEAASGNQIAGNLIRANQIQGRPGGEGVLLLGSNNLVGSNEVAANLQGIVLRGGSARGNQLVGNRVGALISDTGSVLLGGNTQEGILVDNAPDNVVGPNNHIAGNLYGVALSGAGSSRNTVRGNFIGTDPLGNSASLFTRNTLDGVLIERSARNNTLEDNVISGNGRNGILITALDRLGGRVAGNGPAANQVRNNLIGTDIAGLVDLGNVQNGVAIVDPGNPLGAGTSGNIVGPGNTISGNNNGVLLEGAGVSGTTIRGNRIGIGLDGTTDLGNSLDGIRIVNARENLVGGEVPTDANLIGGNNRGIFIAGIDPLVRLGNAIRGNLIGTDAAGDLDLGNKFDGIVIDGASGNVIGGEHPEQGNLIKNNDGTQVAVRSGTGNAILSNRIFAAVGLGIDLNDDDIINPNDAAPDADLGGNNLQNAPNLQVLSSVGNTTTIRGQLVSAPNARFVIQFFLNNSPNARAEGQELIVPNESITEVNGVALFVVTTNAQGVANFAATFNRLIPIGNSVTSTATALDDTPTTDPGDTSEFSGSIADSAGQFDFGVVSTTVLENAGVAQIRIVRSTAGTAGSVLVSTLPPGVVPPGSPFPGGTAVPGVDYTSTSIRVDFAPGQVEAIVNIPILDNTLIDGNRTILVALSAPLPAGGSSLGPNRVAQVTILDDDAVQFRFSVGSFIAPENIGQAPITISLTDAAGNLKAAGVPVSVTFRTENGTAIAGQDYVPVFQTVTFLPGETQKTIFIGIIPDNLVEPDETVRLILSDPTNGATLGQAEGTLILVNTSGPIVESVDFFYTQVPSGRQVKTLIAGALVTFNEPMDKASVENLSNFSYSVQGPGRDGRYNTIDDTLYYFTGAVYDEATRTVRLTLATPLHLGQFYQLTINQVTLAPGATGGVRDIQGNLLDPDANGTAGGRYQTLFAAGQKIQYTDSKGSKVSVQVGKGGLLQLTRFATGEGDDLSVVYGPKNGGSVTGTVTAPGARRPGRGGSGRTTTLQSLRLIPGVRNGLKQPPFFIKQVIGAASASSFRRR